MIISGLEATPTPGRCKIVVGRGAIVLPVVQKCNFLSLEPILVKVKTSTPLTTKDGVQIVVGAVAQVKVSRDLPSIALAAELFLGKNSEEIGLAASEIFVVWLRDVLATITALELSSGINAWGNKIKDVSEPDLAKMGLTAVDFTITELKR